MFELQLILPGKSTQWHLMDPIIKNYKHLIVFRPGEVQFKYVYFNHMNLAQKTTVHSDPRKTTTNINIPVDILRLLADINSDLSGYVYNIC